MVQNVCRDLNTIGLKQWHVKFFILTYKITNILSRNFLLYVWHLGSEEIWIFNKSVQHHWNLQMDNLKGQGLPVSCWVSWVKRYVNVGFLPTQYEASGSNPTFQNKSYKMLKILCVYVCTCSCTIFLSWKILYKQEAKPWIIEWQMLLWMWKSISDSIRSYLLVICLLPKW